MSMNAVIETAIRDSLILDQRIPDPDAVALSADDGIVSLRGTVGSFSQRHAAVSDARVVKGVDEVFD